MVGYSAFGLEARSTMLKKGITLTALAKETGISVTYLSEIFKGTRNGKSQKAKIAQILGLVNAEAS